MWPEGLCQSNIPVTPEGIEPATVRLVAQYRVPVYRAFACWRFTELIQYSQQFSTFSFKLSVSTRRIPLFSNFPLVNISYLYPWSDLFELYANPTDKQGLEYGSNSSSSSSSSSYFTVLLYCGVGRVYMYKWVLNGPNVRERMIDK
jgi:hypothetical protein